MSLINTIIARPYVFIFFAAFMILAIKRWGTWRTVLWLTSGYFIAWLSEFSSIHNGFPYGEYHYIYENLKNELIFMGVPFFDSLSYPFLIFAGYTTAEFILQSRNTKHKTRNTVWPLLLGAFLTMLLDIVIDPVATMGEKWFLGKIHYYAHPGWYFGVPITNFAGWFLVAFAVIFLNFIIWNISATRIKDNESRISVFYPAFYICILLFQTFIAFLIKEWMLGVTNLIITAIIGITASSRMWIARQR